MLDHHRDPKMVALVSAYLSDRSVKKPSYDVLLAHRAQTWPGLVAKAKAMCMGPIDLSGEEAESLIDDILALAGEAA